MTIQTITLYEARTWDGGGGHNSTGFWFSNEGAAKAYKAGHKFDTYWKSEFVIVDSLSDFFEAQQQALKEKALAKLSPAEKKALGL